MKRVFSIVMYVIATIIFSFMIASCASTTTTTTTTSEAVTTTSSSTTEATTTPTSNGQSIFETGKSNLDTITSTGGSETYQAQGGGCMFCHGSKGNNGTAPNITYSALIAEGFNDDAIKKAITTGLDEKGQQLEEGMPRFTMSSQDLTDILDYLKTLK